MVRTYAPRHAGALPHDGISQADAMEVVQTMRCHLEEASVVH